MCVILHCKNTCRSQLQDSQFIQCFNCSNVLGKNEKLLPQSEKQSLKYASLLLCFFNSLSLFSCIIVKNIDTINKSVVHVQLYIYLLYSLGSRPSLLCVFCVWVEKWRTTGKAWNRGYNNMYMYHMTIEYIPDKRINYQQVCSALQ